MPELQEHVVGEQEFALAAAINRLRSLDLSKVFNPDRPDLSPTPDQQLILEEDIRVKYVVGGNRCISKGTQVLTPRGPLAIEELKVGDLVYSEFGTQISVKAVFDQGWKECVRLTRHNHELATCTLDHQWYTKRPSRKEKVIPVSKFQKDTTIHRVMVAAPLGPVNEPDAYAIGALAGDGCCRERSRPISISSENELIPTKVATILGAHTVRRNSLHNYTWQLLGSRHPNHYEEWLENKYAHEKIVDLNTVRSWNRESLLQFVAGLLDTDGSVYTRNDGSTYLQLGMQAKPFVDAFTYALLALWQVVPYSGIDDRDKYKNGPVHWVRVGDLNQIKIILKELGTRVVTTRKQYNTSWDSMSSKQSNLHWVGYQKVPVEGLVHCYDIHVDSPTNLYLLANGLVTHNSGKSAVGARIIAWLFDGSHPYFVRPALWGDGPLTILVIGQNSKQVESELWEKKIKRYLAPGSFKEVRVSQSLQSVVHRETGNKIIFQSHHNPHQASKDIQGHTAHVVWLDELPSSVKLFNELRMRVLTDGGIFIATFTPLIRNDEIKEIIDASKLPFSKKYRLLMMDNPMFLGREAEIEQEFEGMSPGEVAARKNGDWYRGGDLYIKSKPESYVEVPTGYHCSWPHAESSDPACGSGKFGYMQLAERPGTGVWYIVRDEYWDGGAPSDIVAKCTKEGAGVNLVKMIADPAEAWFVTESAKAGRYYYTPNKNNRKKTMLANFIELLGGRVKIAPWCKNIQKELTYAEWDSTEQDLAHSTNFHLIHSAIYFADFIPAMPKPPVRKTRDELLIEMDDARRERNYAKQHKARRSRWA